MRNGKVVVILNDNGNDDGGIQSTIGGARGIASALHGPLLDEHPEPVNERRHQRTLGSLLHHWRDL